MAWRASTGREPPPPEDNDAWCIARAVPAHATGSLTKIDGLSSREIQVLLLLARHYSNREIADSLVLSIRTVERNINNLSAKTAKSYAYDAVGRLTEVRQDGVLTENYAYDANGNRLSFVSASGTLTATHDAQDRVTQYGGALFGYTSNGERQTRTASGQVTSYRYDGLGRLLGASLPNGTQVDYILDGAHRRIGRRVDGAVMQGFLYGDGLRPIAELDSANNVVSRFVYAGCNAPVYMTRSGATYRIRTDQLGSPRLIVDVTTGVVAQRLDYDTFGNVVLNTNPGFQPFGFAGGLYDRSTRLVHFGAREYDPETGRWTTRDPIGFAGADANLYAYGRNDPVNHIDPTGLVDSRVAAAATVCGANPAMCEEFTDALGVAIPELPEAPALAEGAPVVEDMLCRAATLPGIGDFPARLGDRIIALEAMYPEAAKRGSGIPCCSG